MGQKEADGWVTDVIAGDRESFESLLKRFNKRVQQAGVLAEARHREYFEKPSVKPLRNVKLPEHRQGKNYIVVIV